MNVLLYLALLVAVTFYAFTSGERDARVIALACVAGTASTALALSPLIGRYASIETGVAAIDCLLLVIFVAVALQSPRFWPLWISGLQLTTTLAHLIKTFDPDLVDIAYAAAMRFWSYPIVLIVAIGVFRTRRGPPTAAAP